MLPAAATVSFEDNIGRVRKMVEATDAKTKEYAGQRDLAVSKGMGKGKGGDARASAEPYTAPPDDSSGSVTSPEDIQGLLDDSAQQAAGLKEALTRFESMQLQFNTILAKVTELASAHKDL